MNATATRPAVDSPAAGPAPPIPLPGPTPADPPPIPLPGPTPADPPPIPLPGPTPDPDPGSTRPKVPLEVPEEFRKLLAAALGEAAADAVAFAREHQPRDRWLVPGWALLRMSWPPAGEKERAELAYLHEVARSRTAPQTATARYYSQHGLTDAWDGYLAEYQKTVGPRQARAAARLLHDTLNMVNEVTQTAKAAAGRTRPFDRDPTLPIVLDRPGGSPAYPSGHASAAFAAAIVLGFLMPARAKEFLDIAAQASWARVYGGVHFPSDVVAGARLAATVAMYNTAISGIGPRASSLSGEGAAQPHGRSRRGRAA